MPQVARIVIPDVPHHVPQRGNNRQDVFFTADDRRVYLELLHESCVVAGVAVLGYCLMTNHVHLIVVPPDDDALARAVGRTHFGYAQYVNRLHGRSGHLWQGRFYSCPLDDMHLWTALAYVERNPVRAKLTRRAWLWPWSSAAAHSGDTFDPSGERASKPTGVRATDQTRVRASNPTVIPASNPTDAPNPMTDLLDLKAWRAEWTAARWRRQLCEPTDDAWRRRFWRASQTGRPLAEDRWLSRLEARLGRRLRPNPLGRPRQTRRKPAAEKATVRMRKR